MTTKQNVSKGKKSGSTTTASTQKASTNGNGNGNSDSKSSVVLNKALTNMSVEEIQQQLEARKEVELTDLRSRLAKLNEETTSVEQRIAALSGAARVRRTGGGGKGSRGPRVKNERPLSQYLHEILKNAGEPMSARQLEEKLGETDYKSEAKNKYVIIFTALTKNPEMFKKTGRGLYEAVV